MGLVASTTAGASYPTAPPKTVAGDTRHADLDILVASAQAELAECQKAAPPPTPSWAASLAADGAKPPFKAGGFFRNMDADEESGASPLLPRPPE